MPLNEVKPGSSSAFRAGIETILLEDATDGGIGDADSEFPVLTDDAIVVPGVVLVKTGPSGKSHLAFEAFPACEASFQMTVRSPIWQTFEDERW